MMSLWDRFDASGDCWIWTGPTDRRGYGRLGPRLTHRLVWEQLVGPCPLGLEPDHLCRVHPCGNPDHIEWVTHAVNVRRGFGFSGQNARKTTCPYGHPYAPARPYGRKCRVCDTEWHRLHRKSRARAAA